MKCIPVQVPQTNKVTTVRHEQPAIEQLGMSGRVNQIDSDLILTGIPKQYKNTRYITLHYITTLH